MQTMEKQENNDMSDELTRYKQGKETIPETQWLLPLYGAGMENLGSDGKLIQVPVPDYGPDELLVRHDAVGLCFSDTKVIRQGENHPRIYRNMQANPVVLGHEVAMTVVGVGENLQDQVQVGDRFIIQADIYAGGVNLAYGYEIQGGLSQYNVMDQRILNGDDGSYLIPVQPGTGYAESALTEPWACVVAAYQLTYRTGIKAGGTTWIVGTGSDRPYTIEPDGDYTIGAGFDEASHPKRLLLTNVPAAFEEWLRARASALGVEVIEIDDVAAPPEDLVDDIILLGADADLIEALSPSLANFGVMAIVAEEPLARKVQVDVGRVHYNRWLYVGGRGPDIAAAYSDVPVRASLKPGGKALFVGAGGPMGRMHVQRALQVADGPSTIVCTDVSSERLRELRDTFAADARAKSIEFYSLNPLMMDFPLLMVEAMGEGFDDVIVLAPVASVISDSATDLAPGGVMNVFAGVGRGTMAAIDLSGAYLEGKRVIGHSASSIDDLRLMLAQAESGVLSPNRSVAAVGSLSAARDGLQAVQETAFPGKIVIYPNIRDFPLTALPDLKDSLPSVYAELEDGKVWTVEAEEEWLRRMLG
jgi:threonine dehydrogenase-like Zn-dependent dehydrogenase